MKLVVQFFPISQFIWIVSLDVLITDFWNPKIIKVQCDKSQNSSSGNNHISGHPSRICRTLVHRILHWSCIVISDFQNESHYKMENNCENQNRLHQKLNRRIVSHKMRSCIERIFTKYGNHIGG